jgi:hypothetical protein
LGAWISTQRYRRDKLNLEKIKLLETLPQWSWDVLEDQWNEGFECLKKYIEEYDYSIVPNTCMYENFTLGTWVSTQRYAKIKNKLSSNKIKQLESLPQWSWDILEDRWNEGFLYLKKYIEEFNHSRIPVQLRYNDYLLGSWASDQRKRKKQNKLSPDRVKYLDSLSGWSWNVIEDKWNIGFECLKQYIEEHGHAKIPDDLKYKSFNLSIWVNSQKTNYNKGKLDIKRIQLLETLPQWSWNVIESQWNRGFGYLKKYVQEHGHAKIQGNFKYENYNLGAWVNSQKMKKNKLNLEQIKILEELPQWSWNTLEDQWNEGFGYLKKYVSEHGHAKVPSKFEYDDFKLGNWVNAQKANNKNHKLDLDRIKKLESLSQWSWSSLEEQWNEGFTYLKKYTEEQGHARVPARLKYENFNLGDWVGSQRRKKDSLDLDRIKNLESLPQWWWGVRMENNK